jgi:hypothetical protein
VEYIEFWSIIVIGNSNKLQKLILERKINLARNILKFGNYPIYFSAKFHIVVKNWKKNIVTNSKFRKQNCQIFFK